MTKKEVAKVINEWDPIDLISFSPPDEYDIEISLLVEHIQNGYGSYELAKEIQRIFLDRFGNQFTLGFDECLEVAKKILNEQ